MEALKVIRGMRDILPEQAAWWQRMERTLVEVLTRYGYGEIRTPVLEPTELFARSIGEETDIVAKEMYTFTDRDGTSLTLRPENTASVCRAYIEHNRWKQEPISRWYYLGPMFRHERPQKGRYRQFSQVGAELIGAETPAADVEMIEVMVDCIQSIGLAETSLEINSLGCSQCRPGYRSALVAYLTAHRDALCADCRRRLETNPLRVLDCKQEACSRVAEGAPHMLDHLCGACAEHFGLVRAGLDRLELPYAINHRMVRGLDYYTRTTFELLAAGLGAQNAVAAGGRYDGLVADLGGPAVQGVGFAAGLDRILLKLMDVCAPPRPAPVVFFVTRGREGWKAALPLMHALRANGVRVECDVRQGSMKAQMKRADKSGARLVVMLGEDEIHTGKATVKDMAADRDADDKQFRVPWDRIPDELTRRLGRGKDDSA